MTSYASWIWDGWHKWAKQLCQQHLPSIPPAQTNHVHFVQGAERSVVCKFQSHLYMIWSDPLRGKCLFIIRICTVAIPPALWFVNCMLRLAWRVWADSLANSSCLSFLSFCCSCYRWRPSIPMQKCLLASRMCTQSTSKTSRRFMQLYRKSSRKMWWESVCCCIIFFV